MLNQGDLEEPHISFQPCRPERENFVLQPPQRSAKGSTVLSRYFVKKTGHKEKVDIFKAPTPDKNTPTEFENVACKQYCRIKPDKDASFQERMEFDIYKRHSKHRRSSCNSRVGQPSQLQSQALPQKQQKLDKYESNKLYERLLSFQHRRDEKVQISKHISDLQKEIELFKVYQQQQRRSLSNSSSGVKSFVDRMVSDTQKRELKQEQKILEKERQEKLSQRGFFRPQICHRRRATTPSRASQRFSRTPQASSSTVRRVPAARSVSGCTTRRTRAATSSSYTPSNLVSATISKFCSRETTPRRVQTPFTWKQGER